MTAGGNDDTRASSLPRLEGAMSVADTDDLVSGRYRIIRWLGGGGMGRVYEALDTELDERVALKVLRSGLSDEALERFRREVRLTRRIQHPNVARMFDIGEHNGEKYLTMELIKGEPLTRRMSSTPMPWPHLKAIAQQICAGLAAAHAAGVIHRDLKPDNVLIELGSDRAVLTDFGIARSIDDPNVTQAGTIVGTPRYMAPEQLAGDSVDARADLFSLGVILFELATGTRPWAGDNAIAIAVAQVTEDLRTIDATTSSVPAFFAQTIRICLRLDPGARPSSANEILGALASGLTPSARDSTPRLAQAQPPARNASKAITTMLAEPATLAVLPISCPPGDEYLADGLLADLVDTLSTTSGIRVRATSMMRLTSASDPREVGQQLQVEHVVVGLLRRTATGLRISTRLISVADGFLIWAHKSDCTEAEILDVGEDIASEIASALSTRASVENKPTDPRAVELYLRARAELRRFWGRHTQEAATLLEQAVEYAPTSAPILAVAAWAHVQSWVMQGDPTLAAKAQQAVEAALATGHGEAFIAAAQFHFNRGEVERAGADLARALLRAPMSGQAHELAGRILLEIDGPAAARQHYVTGSGLDPVRAHVIESDLARVDALEGNWTDADARIERLIADADPSIRQLGMMQRMRLASWRGRLEEMLESAQIALSRTSANAGLMFSVVGSVASSHTLDADLWARAIARDESPDVPIRQTLGRIQMLTELALVTGYVDLAMQALERGGELGLIDRTWLEHCPLLTGIASDARFERIRREVIARAQRVLAAFASVTTAA